MRGCADEEPPLVVGGADQLPKSDFTAAGWAAGCAAVTEPVGAAAADVLLKPGKEGGASVDAPNTEGVALADSVEAVREGGCAWAAAVVTFPNTLLKFWRDVLLSRDAAAEEALVAAAAGKMGLKPAASRGLVGWLLTDSELLAGGAVEDDMAELT